MISEEKYNTSRPVSELLKILNIDTNFHKIQKGMSKTNPKLMKQLQKENREKMKQIDKILSQYLIGYYNDYDNYGYSKEPVYFYNEVFYSYAKTAQSRN